MAPVTVTPAQAALSQVIMTEVVRIILEGATSTAGTAVTPLPGMTTAPDALKDFIEAIVLGALRHLSSGIASPDGVYEYTDGTTFPRASTMPGKIIKLSDVGYYAISDGVEWWGVAFSLGSGGL